MHSCSEHTKPDAGLGCVIVNVVFVEQAFPANQHRFVGALAQVGATVIGIGERPEDWLDHDLRSRLQHCHQIGSVTDVDALQQAVEWIQDKVWVDRLEATSRRTSSRPRRSARPVRSSAPQCVPPGCAGTSPRGRKPCARLAYRRHPRRPLSMPTRSGPSPRRSSRGMRASTTRCPSTASRCTTSSRTTTRTCWRRCGTGGSPRSSSPPTGSSPPGRLGTGCVRRAALARREGQPGAWHRNPWPRRRPWRLGDAHGVVLRPRGSNNAGHARMVVEELIPHLEPELPLISHPSQRCLMGSSFGAVASLATAARYPHVFGSLLLQSGSFVFTDIGVDHGGGTAFDPVVKFVNGFRLRPRPVAERLFVSCGIYEPLITSNRSMLEVWRDAQMTVNYVESRDGHNWESWRDRLRDGLCWIFPGDTQVLLRVGRPPASCRSSASRRWVGTIARPGGLRARPAELAGRDPVARWQARGRRAMTVIGLTPVAADGRSPILLS